MNVDILKTNAKIIWFIRLFYGNRYHCHSELVSESPAYLITSFVGGCRNKFGMTGRASFLKLFEDPIIFKE
jgi:hypothetical protein